MTVRKIKASWWVDLRAGYVRYRKRSPINTRAGAKTYEVMLRSKLSHGGRLRTPAEVASANQTFAEFSRQWFEDYVVPNNKLSEQRSKQSILRASLVPFFGKMRIAEIGSREIERFKAQTVREGVTNKTINNRLTVLKKCVHTAYDWLSLEGRPPAVVWLKCTPPKTDFLTRNESEQLLAGAEGVVREMVLTALHTGMRQGELKGLQWSSIDWDNRFVTVRHSKNDLTTILQSPKSNRVRHIPLSEELYATLEARRLVDGYVFSHADGSPFTKRQLSRYLDQVCRRSGVRHIGWHTFRHTFASHLAMKSAPLFAIQSLMGHSTINTTMRYAHMLPSTLRGAIDLLTTSDPSVGQPAGIAAAPPS